MNTLVNKVDRAMEQSKGQSLRVEADCGFLDLRQRPDIAIDSAFRAATRLMPTIRLRGSGGPHKKNITYLNGTHKGG